MYIKSGLKSRIQASYYLTCIAKAVGADQSFVQNHTDLNFKGGTLGNLLSRDDSAPPNSTDDVVDVLHFFSHAYTGQLGPEFMKSEFDPVKTVKESWAIGPRIPYFVNEDEINFITIKDIVKKQSSQEVKPGEKGDQNKRVNLLILTACGTAVDTDPHKPDPYGGLALSGIYAGARGVMVTYWSVIQEPATLMMEAFVKKLAENRPKTREEWVWRPAEILAEIQRKMIAGGNNGGFGVEREKKMGWPADTQPWSHPFYWAPFALVN